MKKQSKSQRIKDCFSAYEAIRAGKPVKRKGTKDGSIATHPLVPVPDLLESEVLKDCMKWLKERGIVCNRNNTGSGQMGDSGFYSYGIRGGGDIIGLFPAAGRHFEIEVKRGRGGRLSLEQQKRKNLITANNGVYLIIHGVRELEWHWDILLKHNMI